MQACRAGLTSCDLSFDAICSYSLLTQFVREVTEGEAREKIWSSINYLFFISTSLIYGKNQQVRQGIV